MFAYEKFDSMLSVLHDSIFWQLHYIRKNRKQTLNVQMISVFQHFDVFNFDFIGAQINDRMNRMNLNCDASEKNCFDLFVLRFWKGQQITWLTNRKKVVWAMSPISCIRLKYNWIYVVFDAEENQIFYICVRICQKLLINQFDGTNEII